MNINCRDVQKGGYYYNSNMTPELFGLTDFFKNYTRYAKTGRGDNWGDYRFVKVPLVYWLDELRDIAGSSLNIHCAYEDRKDGYHPLGMACDFHISGLCVVDQFILATKLPFGGIGAYPFWNSPGLHCDIRPLATGIRYYWMRDKYGNYKTLNKIEQIR